MPNPLNPLPSSVTWQDVHAVVHGLPENLPLIDTAPRQQIIAREASIFVGATGSGKTTLLRNLGIASNTSLPPVASDAPYFGVLDDNGQYADDVLVKTMHTMLRFQRQQTYTNPRYKPIILLRNSTWHRIEGYFHWLNKDVAVSQLSFPADLFAASLRPLVPDWFLNAYLTKDWFERCRDARGHFLPAFAWDALKALENGTAMTTAKPRAFAEAGVRIVRSSTAAPFLAHMIFACPEDEKVIMAKKKIVLSRSRLDARLRSAMSATPLPNNWTRPDFIEAAQREGIIASPKASLNIIAAPHAAGYVTLKKTLTLRAIKGM